MELAGRLWNHLPAMFASMAGRGAAWPEISVGEMGDLMAYLQADTKRDPKPDVVKGQQLVLKKGCLKCHSLRREGGPVRPDLAEQRSDYASAASWAATMWTHTPRMAAMASRQGVAYPRFADDEMVNLVGFLRQASGR
jgi:cytochrome c2